MKKHCFKDWLFAMRPWSFPASAMPVIVTLGYLYATGHDICLPLGAGALADIILFHAAGNTWSDYFDYRHHVDAADTFGAKTLTTGMFTPREIFSLSLVLLTAASILGCILLAFSGLPLLYVAAGGIACTLLYPLLKFNSLGDVVIFFNFALFPILGTTYVTTGEYLAQALWIAPAVGLITISILHANNTRDTLTDRRAGIRTLAMNIGIRTSVWLYAFEVLFPFVWVCICVAAHTLPLGAPLALLALPMAIKNAKLMFAFHRADEYTKIAHVDELSAKLQLLFSLLLTMGMIATKLCTI